MKELRDSLLSSSFGDCDELAEGARMNVVLLARQRQVFCFYNRKFIRIERLLKKMRLCQEWV